MFIAIHVWLSRGTRGREESHFEYEGVMCHWVIDGSALINRLQ